MNRTSNKLALVLLLICPLGASGDIVSFEFQRKTNNSPDGDKFASHAFLEVWDGNETGVNSDQVLFRFINDSNGAGMPGTFTQLYWDDSTALFSSSSNPQFSSHPAHTSDDSSGQATMAFSFDSGSNDKPPGLLDWNGSDTDFNFDADPPPVHTGVEQLEFGGFLFTLADQNTTLSEISRAMIDGDLRVAMHAQGIGGPGGDSETFVAAPEPSGAVLVAGLFGLWLLRRHRRPDLS